MRNGLMKEMLWQQKPQTLELYQLKKDLKSIPKYQNLQITEMNETQVRQLKEKRKTEKAVAEIAHKEEQPEEAYGSK